MTTLLLLVALLAVGITIGRGAGEVDWSTVPVPSLTWAPCGGDLPNFQCATISAPLDYTQAADRRSITLTLIKLPALGTPTQGQSTLFVNFGGPGEPGTSFLPTWSTSFPTAIRASMDIVSWDPRGVGFSTAVQCFDTQAQLFDALGNKPNLHLATYYPLNSTAAQDWTQRLQDLATPCRNRNGDLLDYVSTADTAFDLELMRRAVGDTRLSFWGISYGSLIGQTYANLFPRSFRALIIDGVLDPVEWFANFGLSASLRTKQDLAASSGLEAFLHLCGTSHTCPFSAGGAIQTRTKWARLLRWLRTNGPIPAAYYGTNFGENDVSSLMNQALMPTVEWLPMAYLLESLWINRTLPRYPDTPPPATPGPVYAGPEQMWAIQCSEAWAASQPGYYWQQAQTEAARGGVLSAAATWLDAPCLAWPGIAKNAYMGPWNVPTPVSILVIGNTHDTATAYVNSVEVTAGRLANATLLTLDGVGHTALLSGFSKCINQHVSDYVLMGALPPANTVCSQDCVPFAADWDNCTGGWQA